jgi:molybdopterin molybdotransferase
MGLPGNPMSVAVTFRRFAWPLLRRLGGFALGGEWERGSAGVRGTLKVGDGKSLHLHWYRLVQLDSEGYLELVGHQGSGDVVALGRSVGFIEVPAGQATEGAFR